MDHRNFFAGTVTDRVVRQWLDGEPDKNLGLMPDMVQDIMRQEEAATVEQGGHIKWRDLEDRDRVLHECIDAVTRIEPLLIENVLPYQYVADFGFRAPLEVPYGDSMLPVVLNGYMDVLVKDDDGNPRVWDVKHTKNNDYWRKTAGQLAFYDLAMFILEGKYTVETGLMQPLCNEPLKVIPLDDKWRNTLMAHITRMASDVVRNVNTPRKDTKLCNYCEVKHACIKYHAPCGRVSLFN